MSQQMSQEVCDNVTAEKEKEIDKDIYVPLQ